MIWRPIGYILRLVVAVIALCAAAFWLWPYFGVVGVVVTILSAILAVNLLEFTLLRPRAPFRASRPRARAVGKADARPRSNDDPSTPPNRLS